MVISLGPSGTLVLRRARTRGSSGSSVAVVAVVAVLQRKLSHADGQGVGGLRLRLLLLLLLLLLRLPLNEAWGGGRSIRAVAVMTGFHPPYQHN